MKVLVDAAFPISIDNIPNSEGVSVERVKSMSTDRRLLEFAAAQDFPALVILDSEIISQASIRKLAKDLNVTLICSATDDPFEAEVNLRQALSLITSKVVAHRGEVLWLRKDGLRPARVK